LIFKDITNLEVANMDCGVLLSFREDNYSGYRDCYPSYQRFLSQLVESEIRAYLGMKHSGDCLEAYTHNDQVQLFDIFVVGGAVSAVIRFERRLKNEIGPKHKSFAKLLSFKGMVIFQFFQQFIFGFLNGQIFKPSATLTYDDIYYGIPNVLTCVESFIFSILFIWSFNSNEYHPDNVRTGGHKMSTWRAILDAMNLSDIVKGIILMFRLGISVGPGTPKFVSKLTQKSKAQKYDDDMVHLEPYSGGRSERRSNESFISQDSQKPYSEGGYSSQETAYQGPGGLETPRPSILHQQGYGSYTYIAPPRSASPSPTRGSQRA
jgi:hypothetical protein